MVHGGGKNVEGRSLGVFVMGRVGGVWMGERGDCGKYYVIGGKVIQCERIEQEWFGRRGRCKGNNRSKCNGVSRN